MAVTGVSLTSITPATAVEYPSWEQLQAAKADTAAAAKAVETIKSLIAGLQQNVAATEAIAEEKLGVWMAAQEKYDLAVARANDLQAQADAAAGNAAKAKQTAGEVAAQLYRSGSGDQNIALFLDAGNGAATDQFLAKLDNMELLVGRINDVYDQARAQENLAKSLTQQAVVARDERERLNTEAEQAFAVAEQAAQAAAAALAESEAKQDELNAQLAFLQDKQAKTAAAYEEGERVRKAEEERLRKLEEERRRQEALANANNPASSAGTDGWRRPVGGRLVDRFGPRPVWCANGSCTSPYHHGIDLAASCGTPVVAAQSGTVRFAGWGYALGNFVQINHGNGIYTGYAHNTSMVVGVGQHVEAGQVIAYSGTTGQSTGCHVHFEVYQNGTRIDPVPFFAARGVRF